MRWQVVICVCFLVLTEATTFHRRSENLSRKARNNDDEKTNQTKDQETSLETSPSPPEEEEEEITTTEAYIQPVTTAESTSTEAPTTQAPTPAPGDLVRYASLHLRISIGAFNILPNAKIISELLTYYLPNATMNCRQSPRDSTLLVSLISTFQSVKKHI